MLSNPDMFATVEQVCRERGIIDRFEAENGEIKGHMMIDVVGIPEDVSLKPSVNGAFTAFEASFDFMDAIIGLVLCMKKMEAATGFWVRNTQSDEVPDNVWAELFVKTLIESIEPGGSYGVPIYVFISDGATFSVVPTAPDNPLCED